MAIWYHYDDLTLEAHTRAGTATDGRFFKLAFSGTSKWGRVDAADSYSFVYTESTTGTPPVPPDYIEITVHPCNKSGGVQGTVLASSTINAPVSGTTYSIAVKNAATANLVGSMVVSIRAVKAATYDVSSWINNAEAANPHKLGVFLTVATTGVDITVSATTPDGTTRTGTTYYPLDKLRIGINFPYPTPIALTDSVQVRIWKQYNNTGSIKDMTGHDTLGPDTNGIGPASRMVRVDEAFPSGSNAIELRALSRTWRTPSGYDVPLVQFYRATAYHPSEQTKLSKVITVDLRLYHDSGARLTAKSVVNFGWDKVKYGGKIKNGAGEFYNDPTKYRVGFRSLNSDGTIGIRTFGPHDPNSTYAGNPLMILTYGYDGSHSISSTPTGAYFYVSEGPHDPTPIKLVIDRNDSLTITPPYEYRIDATDNDGSAVLQRIAEAVNDARLTLNKQYIAVHTPKDTTTEVACATGAC